MAGGKPTCHLLSRYFVIDPEDEGGIFLRNVG
jgi:hypothetical protein